MLASGDSEASLDSSGRLSASLPIINNGNTAATRVRISSISLDGARLTTALPISFETIRPGEQVTVQARFVGDQFTRGASYTVKASGSLLDRGEESACRFSWQVRIGNAGSSVSSTAPNTTSGARNPHEPPNFERANSGKAWVVPTVPTGSEPGSPATVAAPASGGGSVRMVANASVGSAPDSGLAPKEIDGLWGYVTPGGVVKIPAKFSEAGSFYGGFARVKVGAKYGMISAAGAYVLQPNYDGLSTVASEGLVAAEPKSGAGWGFVELGTGKTVIAARFAEAMPFHEGLAAVMTGGKWGYIGKSGAFKIGARFDAARPFENGKAKVLLGGQWVQVNQAGVIVPE
jgi:hypothetical protein